MRDLNFKCIAEGCRRTAVDSHAVCNLHLMLEIAATVVCFTSFLGLLLWGLLRAMGKPLG